MSILVGIWGDRYKPSFPLTITPSIFFGRSFLSLHPHPNVAPLFFHTGLYVSCRGKKRREEIFFPSPAACVSPFFPRPNRRSSSWVSIGRRRERRVERGTDRGKPKESKGRRTNVGSVAGERRFPSSRLQSASRPFFSALRTSFLFSSTLI